MDKDKIITYAATKWADEAYRVRFGYPDRVGEVGEAYLNGTATQEDVDEAIALINTIQATWDLFPEEEV